MRLESVQGINCGHRPLLDSLVWLSVLSEVSYMANRRFLDPTVLTIGGGTATAGYNISVDGDAAAKVP